MVTIIYLTIQMWVKDVVSEREKVRDRVIWTLTLNVVLWYVIHMFKYNKWLCKTIEQ